jgi:hypothetical protein
LWASLTHVSFLWLPETKQRTLEELDYVFSVPTRKHMAYQAGPNLSWWFNTTILRKKGLVKPQLYKFGDDEVSHSEPVTARVEKV